MTSQYIMSQLLKSDAKNLNNTDLLKKIILTVSLGRLLINGQLPDKTVKLADYLFDNERLIIDFSRISEEEKNNFLTWLLHPHQQDKIILYNQNIAVNEHRGFTAETSLSWFGRIRKWIRSEPVERWNINNANDTLNYNVSSINMRHGLHGLLIGFAFAAKIPLESKPNTKRVFITKHLIALIQNKYTHPVNYMELCDNCHPLSIDVTNHELRSQNMSKHREEHQYIPQKNWYQRLWNWFISWFKKEPIIAKDAAVASNNEMTLLHETKTIKLFQKSNNHLIVQEKKPPIENLVYAGGGARMFAHVGVWKALQETGIVPKRFAGSSAGAIMSLLCYLGFDSKRIAELFQQIKKEHVLYFNINSKGLSDARALKTTLDYFIALKIEDMVTQYQIARPQGEITFALLHTLKKQYPNCGIGDEFVVTATNKHLSKTSYFSVVTTPDMEVSEAVKASCSIPLVFRDTHINGNDFNDGGVLNNFPTNVYHQSASTFLESEYGNNMQTLAVQFNTGIEYSIVNENKRIYKEHFIKNWILGLLAGVNDPVGGWEQDRLRLKKYSGQTILIDAENVAVADFNIKEEERQQLVVTGHLATLNYLNARYAKNENGTYVDDEAMYTTFHSLEELLIYTCYRGDLTWFNIIRELIIKNCSDKLVQPQHELLHALYFEPLSETEPHLLPNTLRNEWHQRVFLALYPILLKLSTSFIKNLDEHDLFERARHVFKPDAPLRFCANLAQIKGETHIFFYIFSRLTSLIDTELQQIHPNSEELEKYCAALHLLNSILESEHYVMNVELFAQWDLNFRQIHRVLKCFERNSSSVLFLCDALKQKQEPLQRCHQHVFDADDLIDASISTRYC